MLGPCDLACPRKRGATTLEGRGCPTPELPARASRQPGSLGTGPQGPCCYRASPEPDRKKGPRRQASRKTGGEEVAPPAPSARSQPLGPTLRGVIGSGGRRRAGGDSRETARLSAAICLSGRDRPGRCGPGSSRPRPPPRADPGLRGSQARPLNGAGWRQGSGRRGSGRGDGDGRQRCPPLPSFLRTQQAEAKMHAPRGACTAGHGRRAPRVSRAQPGHTPKPPRTWCPPQASAPLPAGTRAPSATGPCPPGHHSRRIPAQGHSPRHPGRPPPRPLTARRLGARDRRQPAQAQGRGHTRPGPPPPGFRVAGGAEGPQRVQRAGGRRPAPARRPGPGRAGRGGAAERASPARLRGSTDAK